MVLNTAIKLYQINQFDSVEELCLAYLEGKGLKDINKAVIGAAAPILGDKVSFVNTSLEFSIKELSKISSFQVG